ncbi:polysaccharide deacetylase family protein [Haloarcula marina]|uniref:polysaccharide deacetylase family protein n=1 Tax=Haloarcula marina TaxID=2961574 RepID=UPI0020B8A555|nr:polysaccharide deacetylase family protein [Halomicroarcula marina]
MAVTALAGAYGVGSARAAAEHPLLQTSFDATERYEDSGELLDDFEDLDAWTASEGEINPETDDVYKGSQSAELFLSADDSGDLEVYREYDGLDLSEKALSLAIKLISPFTEQLVVTVKTGSGDVQMKRRTIGPNYGWFRIDLGVTGEDGDPDLSDVEEIELYFNRDFDEDIRALVDDLRVTERTDRGRVVVTFDDGGITQYDTALPIMEARDIPALTMINSGRAPDDDYLGEAEMREMRDAGWEIGSHTVDHADLLTLSDAEVRQQVEDNKRWLLERGFERGSWFFSYPWSGNTPAIRDIVGDYHYAAVTDGSLPHGGQLTAPLTIGRVFGEELDRVEDTIALAEKYDQTLVLAYHQVGESGWISEDDFRATMDRIADSDIEAVRPSTLLTDVLSPSIQEVVPLSVREAVAGDGSLELPDIQRAIDWYERDAYVPRTNGEQIDDQTLDDLIQEWKND